MSRRASAAVTVQPKADGGNFPDPAAVLLALNPEEVKNWTHEQVIQEFLGPIGLEHLGPLFQENNVTGDVLLHLEKRDLKDMKIANVGDRLYIDQCLDSLRKHNQRLKREKVIWRGETPPGKVSYFDTCWQCMAFKFCKCFMSPRFIKITAQGYTRRDEPPALNICCYGLSNDFEDFRLLKDIQWQEDRRWCCLSTKKCILQFDASVDQDDDGKVGGPSQQLKKVEIAHPDMTDDMIKNIKNAWTESRLVAD